MVCQGDDVEHPLKWCGRRRHFPARLQHNNPEPMPPFPQDEEAEQE
jgi:hypothetical protein